MTDDAETVANEVILDDPLDPANTPDDEPVEDDKPDEEPEPDERVLPDPEPNPDDDDEDGMDDPDGDDGAQAEDDDPFTVEAIEGAINPLTGEPM